MVKIPKSMIVFEDEDTRKEWEAGEKRLEAMKNEALKEKDWERYLGYFDSQERMDGFKKIHKELSDKEYFELLAFVISSHDNFWQYQNDIIRLLHNRDKKYWKYLMDEKERKRLASLPNTLTIYRGCKEGNRNGLSWTLSSKVAQFFTGFLKGEYDFWQGFRSGATELECQEFNQGKTLILKGECKKKDVICFLNGRNEKEILIEPEKVKIVGEL